MNRNYALLIDNSQESQKAIEMLNKKGIDYKVMDFPTDGELKIPVLFIPEGRCEGLNIISSYIETAYPN